MRLLATILSISLGITSSAWGARVEGPQTNDVRVVPMKPTPEPDEVEVRFAFPEAGEVKTQNPVKTQLRLEAYPLGFMSDFPRAREIRDSNEGQTLHIVLDGKHHFDINEAIDDVAENEEIDFDQIIEAKIPYNLSEGIHILRAFPVRSFGESLKGPDCFASIYFYFGKAENKPSIDLSQPYLTYNAPEGEFRSNQPILLDFYLTNTQLSKDGYKVRLTIDGTDKRILTEWTPYFIYGLKKGSHTIKIELLDPQNKVLAPLFNDLEQTIVVK
jgi:hypothetical protein